MIERENHVGKGRGVFMTLPYNGVWMIDKENLVFASSVLIEDQSTTDMLRDSIDMVFKQWSDFGYKNNSSGTTCRISLTFSSWKNGKLC